jgi:hypothetical protein
MMTMMMLILMMMKMMMVIDDDHDVGLDYEREHDYYYIYIYICTTICMLCIWEFIAVPLSPKWLLGKSARRLRGVGGQLQGGFLGNSAR